MIIGLSGRKNSGKTSLSNEGRNIGFRILSFQEEYEKLAKIVFCEKEEMIVFCERHLKKIIQELPSFDSKGIGLQKSFDRKDAATFLREEVFWKDNEHLILDRFKTENENSLFKEFCIIDDIKTKSEKDFVSTYEHIMFFVARLNDFSYKNSLYEVDLMAKDFDDFIFNRHEGYLSKVLIKFRNFLNILANRKFLQKKGKFTFNGLIEFRNFLKKESSKSLLEMSKMFGVTLSSISSYHHSYYVDSRRQKFSIDNNAFSKMDEETAYFAGVFCADGCLKTSKNTTVLTANLQMTDLCIVNSFKSFLKSGYSIQEERSNLAKRKPMYGCFIQSPEIIENLKLWNIKPRKSSKEEVPFPLIINSNLVKPWIVGLIDGDGYVAISRVKGFSIGLICSNEVADFILNFVPIEIGLSRCFIKTKNGLSMSRIRVGNHKAVDFFNWLGKPNYGLPRKWENVLKFQNLRTKRRTPTTKYSS